jgi:hypothetical protein
MFHPLSRRDLLKTASCGFGYLALAGLATEESVRAAGYTNPLAPKAPHFTPRAKRVIFACMQGAPSHVDTFDYKPALARDEGKELAEFQNRKLMPSPFKFQEYGDGGPCISELFPNLQQHADKLCTINSMWTDVPNHPQAFLMLHTGEFRFARPSMGSWTLYGLGTENQNLPGFITIAPVTGAGGAQNYSSGFLPAIYQGTPIAQVTGGAPIGNLSSSHLPANLQRDQLDLVQALNRDLLARKEANAELEGVIEAYELAFRMQDALPEVLDLKSESKETLEAYGVGRGPADNFGRQCLMARRLAESGVRFIEIQKNGWDQHGNLRTALKNNCTAIDQPLAALLQDLAQRDMLKDTLVVWGGEFGRTPHVKQPDGRDHNGTAYTMWMAGGGVKGGIRYGASDEYGIKVAEKKVHPHDLQATILHLLGLDHERLTYRYGGRDYKLTSVGGARVVEEIVV